MASAGRQRPDPEEREGECGHLPHTFDRAWMALPPVVLLQHHRCAPFACRAALVGDAPGVGEGEGWGAGSAGVVASRSSRSRAISRGCLVDLKIKARQGKARHSDGLTIVVSEEC